MFVGGLSTIISVAKTPLIPLGRGYAGGVSLIITVARPLETSH